MANATIDAKKAKVFKTHGGSEKNTGSVESQIALLTERIEHISAHINNGNKKDHSSNRGLLKMVGQRKRLLKYMAGKDIEKYRTLIGKLGLRK